VTQAQITKPINSDLNTQGLIGGVVALLLTIEGCGGDDLVGMYASLRTLQSALNGIHSVVGRADDAIKDRLPDVDSRLQRKMRAIDGLVAPSTVLAREDWNAKGSLAGSLFNMSDPTKLTLVTNPLGSNIQRDAELVFCGLGWQNRALRQLL
jgi:hypothetical protein